jgi:hypothetical protein
MSQAVYLLSATAYWAPYAAGSSDDANKATSYSIDLGKIAEGGVRETPQKEYRDLFAAGPGALRRIARKAVKLTFDFEVTLATVPKTAWEAIWNATISGTGTQTFYPGATASKLGWLKIQGYSPDLVQDYLIERYVSMEVTAGPILDAANFVQPVLSCFQIQGSAAAVGSLNILVNS